MAASKFEIRNSIPASGPLDPEDPEDPWTLKTLDLLLLGLSIFDSGPRFDDG